MRNNSSWEAFEFYKVAMDIQKRFLKSFEQKQELLEIIHSMMSPIILLGFPEESMKILEEGAELSKELNDQKSLIRFYSNMGFYHSVRGKHHEGIQFSGKAFEEATSIGDITSMAQTAPDLCLANISAGRYATVIDISSRMIHAIRKAGRERDNFGGPAVVYASFFAISGFSEAHLGKFDKGMTKCREGIEEAAKSDNAFTKSICSLNAGMSLLLRGTWKEAKDYLLSSLDYLEKAKFIQIEGMARAGLGVAETYLGNPKLGKKWVKEGLTMHQNAGIEWQVSNLKGYMGMCCYESGDLNDALRFTNEAFEVAVKNDQISLKGKALIWVGRIAGKLSDETANEAESKINEGLDLLNALDIKPDISMGHLFLGELYAERNQQDQARLHLKEAKGLFKEMGMDYWLKETERTIDRSHLENMLL
jgi:tetratricopeptide (TPR) repeat protein